MSNDDPIEMKYATNFLPFNENGLKLGSDKIESLQSLINICFDCEEFNRTDHFALKMQAESFLKTQKDKWVVAN